MTGRAGFLGSHLCDRLLEAGHEVLCVDNFFTGGKENSETCYQPLPEDDPRQRRPDIDLVREKLDWEPAVALRDGLKPTVEYSGNLRRRGLS